jgi:shikimate kinase
MLPKNIFLVGPMGVGKTTIGRMLASKLHFDFVDTDHLIEENSGADIAWIFDVEGEDGFREREYQALAGLAEKTKSVIATGGGIVVRKQNRNILNKLDCVIYLQAGLEKLVERTSRDRKRPLLQVDDPRAKIESLLSEREPFYNEVADFSVLTDGQSPKSTVQTILKRLQS